jgi:AraC-like DNA-binding protein
MNRPYGCLIFQALLGNKITRPICPIYSCAIPKAMTNQSPNQIIRGMRLLRDKELLEKKAGNASEVAFMVGSNSLAYFSKCYRDWFGVPPSAVGS